ncbi:MAG TPA: bifunctional folylpolyglutamate synthase/dihydrofolate synthase [Aquificales bacterium]|nr:bifunctional folylpolyglutamate synthase/dihydrofolate synthase [Aquificales bacterium]
MELWNLFRGLELNFTPTLERIENALRELGNPQDAYPSVLIGGTNGKGSVSAFLESLYRHHGLKTGRFVSPHLVDETERWRINNVPITEKTLKGYIKRVKPLMEKHKLTYFESALLIATLLFKEEGVDIAVVEVGLGGRWDATKVHSPLATAITNVGLDHTKWLGETLEEIADDKTELIYPNTPVILGTDEEPLYSIAKKKAASRNSPLIVANRDYTFKGEVKFPKTLLRDYRYKNFLLEESQLGLYGAKQVQNAAQALTIFLETAPRLGIKPDLQKVKDALKNTRWEGRFEIVGENPLLVLDGAHNLHALRRTLEDLKTLPRFPFIVYGTMRDKDWKDQMALIRRYTDRIGLVEVNYHRSEELENLFAHAVELGFREIRTYKGVKEMLESLEGDTAILGSLYLIGEVKRYLTQKGEE